MKKLVYLISFIALVSFFSTNEMFAIARPDMTFEICKKGPYCEHGASMTFKDTDGDGEFDKVIKRRCDGSVVEEKFSIQSDQTGEDPLPFNSEIRIISGEFGSDSWVAEVYTVDENGVETVIATITSSVDASSGEVTVIYTPV